MSSIHDPGLYRRMSEPFPDPEAAQEAWSAFVEDLRAIREKHHIRDLFVVAEVAIVVDGVESAAVLTMHNGNAMNELPLAAYGYGEASERQKSFVSSMEARARKHAAKR